MDRTIVISGAAHARLRELAAEATRATGTAVSFADVLDSLLEGT
jgi:hypothetical protein